MSAPMVAGAVALMLEGDGQLTATDIRDRLEHAARRDQFTGATPNDEWGAGKLDVEASCKLAAPHEILASSVSGMALALSTTKCAPGGMAFACAICTWKLAVAWVVPFGKVQVRTPALNCAAGLALPVT